MRGKGREVGSCRWQQGRLMTGLGHRLGNGQGHVSTGYGRSVVSRQGSLVTQLRERPKTRAQLKKQFQDRWRWSLLLRLQQLRVYQTFRFWGFSFILVWFWFCFPFENKTNCSYSFLSSSSEKMPPGLLWVKNKPWATPGGCPPSLHCSSWDKEESTGFPELRGNTTCSQMFMIWF